MTMDLDTALLRAFVSVVRSGSINRAASRLQRTQPAVSQQIRKLEQQLGQPLLERSPRGIRLTGAGESLLPYAERLLMLTDQLLPGLGSQPASAQHRRIGIMEDFVGTRLPRVLADFASVHPGLRLSVTVGLKVELFAAMNAGELDVMVSSPLGDSGPLLKPEAQFLCPLAWFAARGKPLATASLPLVIFSAPCSWREQTLATLNRAGQPWHIVFESFSLPAIQAAVEAGLGVAAMLADTPPANSCCINDGSLPPLPGMPVGVYRQSGDSDPLSGQLAALFCRELGEPVALPATTT
ncbi:MAG TPA: LysR family transcriptional regulator [Pseudogulbenkiania sp.]|nr:LysR family transcriptional regulator [Pseudogulbenkiania sp.]